MNFGITQSMEKKFVLPAIGQKISLKFPAMKGKMKIASLVKLRPGLKHFHAMLCHWFCLNARRVLIKTNLYEVWSDGARNS